MSQSLALSSWQTASELSTVPLIPWRDPHTVPAAELTAHIKALERACLDNPASADLRTVLGMAYAVNLDVYKSMDALEAAVAIEPRNFWAQLKYAELNYRLRALARAEELTVTALNLAANGWQLSLARRQLQEIRRLRREGARDVTWNKPLFAPVLVLCAMVAVMTVVMMWK